MFWAIELEVGFQRWRVLVQGMDTLDERLRWLKMCHRLGEQAATDIVCRQQLRTSPVMTRIETLLLIVLVSVVPFGFSYALGLWLKTFF